MPKLPANHPLQKLRSQPQSSPVAMTNAANWNAPGGGYDKFKQGDAAREQAPPPQQEPMTQDSPIKRLKLKTAGQPGN